MLAATGENKTPWIECCECQKPRVIYSEEELSNNYIHRIAQLKSEKTWACAQQLLSGDQVVIVNQRLLCTSSVENRYYKRKGMVVVCHSCGSELDEKNLRRFYDEIKNYRTVLPACTACSDGPNDGWVIKTAAQKQGVISKAVRKRPRKHIDLQTFVERKFEVNFADWLTDSKLSWDQRRFEKRAKRRLKKQKLNDES